MDEPYATIADLRAEGLDEATVADDRALTLILLASRRIDWLTGQWFFPRVQTLQLDGDGSHLLRHPTQIPILAVRSLVVAGRTFSPSEFVHRERYLELVEGGFPAGRGNVELEGVFGWLEPRSPATTSLAVTLAHGQTEIVLLDPTGFQEKDALLVDDRVPAIAGEIAGQQVAVDPVRGGAVMSTSVAAYGRVPRPIERACVMLALRNRHGVATEAGALLAREARMVEERTDNYRYKLSTPAEPVPGGGEGGDVTSGDIEVDRLLADFVAPPYVGVV